MTAYWKRLGELEGGRAGSACGRPSSTSRTKLKASGSSNNKKAEQFLQWMSVTLIPMLQQTEGSPCGLAKFFPEELTNLAGRLYTFALSQFTPP
jgi:hypothetical protein